MKAKAVFICQACGAQSPKWMGRCSVCGEWNTLVEELEEEASVSETSAFPASEPVLYREIKDSPRPRTLVRMDEVNKVLGGGVAVPGSVVLIGGGEPGDREIDASPTSFA